MPRYATVAAFALLFGALSGMLVVAANTGDAKNTGDLTAEEIYARYLDQTADLTFLVERRHTVLVDPLSGTVVLEDSRDVLWDIRRNHPGNQKLFINFPCNCLDEGYPVAIELLGLEEIEGRKLIHLFITDPNRQNEPGSPETIVVWQDLYSTTGPSSQSKSSPTSTSAGTAASALATLSCVPPSPASSRGSFYTNPGSLGKRGVLESPPRFDIRLHSAI